LLDRCRATNTCPKILETFGSAEIWGLRQSFTLVGTSAKADIPRPDNVRRYYFSSVSHGGGAGGFTTTPPPIGTGGTCELPTNPAPVGPMRAALMKSLIAWVTTNTPMPAERFPSIADGTLVRNTRQAMGFPDIPSTPSPEGLQYPLIDYDAGPVFRYADQSGVATKVPVVTRTLPQLVVKVDADGNETAGIRSPLVMAPLGTYTGWNVAASGVFKGQICVTGAPVGGFIPFATSRSERLARRDPRLSLEERYRDHEGYVRAVSDAAQTLVGEGYLLPRDAAEMIAQAAASDILK
jgi:Alpha/beta hydrolase domain